jgi:hypothetical protein
METPPRVHDEEAPVFRPRPGLRRHEGSKCVGRRYLLVPTVSGARLQSDAVLRPLPLPLLLLQMGEGGGGGNGARADGTTL